MPFVSSTAPIASFFGQCHDTLKSLCTILKEFPDANPGKAETHLFNEELGRLNLWNDDVQADNGLLDHSLRKNTVLRNRVLELLTELNNAAEKAVHRHANGEDDLKAPSSEGLSSVITTESGYTPDAEYSRPLSQTALYLQEIQNIITSLFRLAPSIKEPAPRDSNNQITEFPAANPDLFRVEKRFPTADKGLTKRLGHAAWKRRQYLMSLSISYPRLTSGNEKRENIAHSDLASRSDRFPQSLSVREAQHGNHPYHNSMKWTSSSTSHSHTWGQLSTSTPRDSSRQTAATPLTGLSTAPSLVDSASCETTPEEEPRLCLPRPPSPNRDFTGTTFKCPYCLMLLADVVAPRTWKHHLMTDLEPYMCTVGDCPVPDKTYRMKHDWFRHELEVHRLPRFWTCSACQKDFTDRNQFEEHLLNDHNSMFTSHQLASIVASCEHISSAPLSQTNCPLCNQVCLDQDSLKRHLADEMEQLALFALPSGTQLEDDGLDLMEDSGSESSEPIKGTIRFAGTVGDRPLVENRSALVERYLEDHGERDQPEIISDRRSSVPNAASHNLSVTLPLEPLLQRVRTPSVCFPVSTVRHPRDENFFGRDDLLVSLHNQLQRKGQTCVIQGIGGVGKTLLAVEYAHRYANHYDCAFWLQADTDPGLTESCCSLAMELGILDGNEDSGQIIEIAREWLEITDKRWLVIVDNVEEWKAVFHSLPPDIRNTNGSVIITTQHANLTQFSVVTIPLHPLNRDEGGEMLLHYLQNSKLDEVPNAELTQQVSEFVGGLPVAIAHVAGYVTYSQCPLEELLEIFLQRQQYAAGDADVDISSSFRKASFSYEETLAVVCNITLRELPKDSQDLIFILSYMNGDAVAESLLCAVHEDPSLEFLNAREQLRYNRMKSALLRRRLIQKKEAGGEKCLSIHRELQRTVRETLSQNSIKENVAFNQAVTLVQKSFPEPSPIQVPEPEKWPQYKRLLPHVSSLRSVYVASKGRICGSIDFAKLLSAAGVNQWEQGITKEGSELLCTAEEILESDLLDDSSVMRADIHCILGLMTDSIGISQRREGFDRRLKLLSIRQNLAPESKSCTRGEEILLYNAYTDLACSLIQYNDYKQVEPILKICFNKYKEWGNEDDVPYEYAKYYRHLAVIRMYQEKYDDAILLGKQAVYWMGKSGNNNLSYRYKFDLACIIVQSGDLKLALEMHEEILSARSFNSGKNNELTLHSCYASAVLHEAEGRLEEAERLLKEAMDRRRAADWSDEAVARTRYHLSRILTKQNKELEKAQKLHSEAREVLNRLLPLHMPEWLVGEEDEEVLFDHLLTAMGGMFTGQKLLKRFLEHQNCREGVWAPVDVSASFSNSNA